LLKMRRYLLPALVAGAAVMFLALLVFAVSHQGENTSIDAAVARGGFPVAPDAHMALPVLGSSRHETLSDFRGEVVVLNVFAEWCDQCQAEAPVLEHAQQTIAGKRATVLGVTYLDTSSDSEQYVHQWHLTYPVVRDVDGSFIRGYGTDAVPETFVIDRQGRIVAVRRYQIDGAWLASTLAPLLGERS
jgi:cytochrome c biogenesis protein CcmG/thiol:disulfide interchange protein DsbE